MIYVFKPFWSLLTKGGEAYELIVFKRVLMGGCIILPSFYNSHLFIHLILWVVTLKLDGRLLLLSATLSCDDKFRMKSFYRRPFSIMHIIIFIIFLYAWWIVFTLWRWPPQSKTCHVHLHWKADYLYAHLQGEPRHMYEDNTHNTKLSHTSIPVWKLQPVCHQSPKRGRL